MTFHLGIHQQKHVFGGKFDPFFSRYFVLFEPLLGWKYEYVCHDWKTEKEGIYSKIWKHKTTNWYTADIHVGK